MSEYRCAAPHPDMEHRPKKRKAFRPAGAFVVLACFLFFCLCAAGACGARGAGGGDPIANVPAEKTPLRLESAEMRPFAAQGAVSGARYTMREGKILAVANGFSLDLVFSDALSPEQLEDAIQIRGQAEVEFQLTQPDTAGGERVVNVLVPAILPGEYQLIISAGLSGADTLAMETPVTVTLQLDGQTEGTFFLLDSSGLPRPITYEECRNGLALSDTAKTFIIHFNQEVNQVSVEDSLSAGLREQPVISAFSWLTPQQLRVNLTQLQTGMSYHLLLEQGIDTKGNGILGSCYFRTGKASNVGVILLETNEMNMIYQFSEERYSGIRSQIINNRALLQAGGSLTWSFGLGTRQLVSLPSLRYDLALPQSYREPIWVDYEHLLGFDSQTKNLGVVSVTDGTVTPLYTLPERPFECRLSPNGRLLAVVYRSSSDNGRASLLLLDVQNKSLVHQSADFTQPYTTPTGLSAVNLTWTGNDTFIYADGDDILRAYLSGDGRVTDRTNVIETDSRILDYYLEQDILLCRPVDAGADSLSLVQDNKSRLLRGISAEDSGFYCLLVNEGSILFQRGEEIFRYDTAGQTTELVGGGLLLGLSSGRDKAYYMINADDYNRAAP